MDIISFGGNARYIILFGLYDNEQGYEERENGLGFYIYEFRGKDVMGFSKGCCKDLEVIGNIYENPDLLN